MMLCDCGCHWSVVDSLLHQVTNQRPVLWPGKPIRGQKLPPIIKHHQTQRGDTKLRGFEAWVTEDREDNLLIV